MGSSLRRAHLWYLVAGLGPATAALWLRPMRWRALLPAERTVPRATVFLGKCHRVFRHYVLPARGGDLLRTGVIDLETKTRAPPAVTERLADDAAQLRQTGIPPGDQVQQETEIAIKRIVQAPGIGPRHQPYRHQHCRKGIGQRPVEVWGIAAASGVSIRAGIPLVCISGASDCP